MLRPSPEIVLLLTGLASAMTAPTLANALVLLYGTILAPGQRTVTAALRMMGLQQSARFSNYHRVLNRARWSPLLISRWLLGLLVRRLVPAGAPLCLLVDETLEPRQGAKIRYQSWFRDALRSTAGHVHKALGLRWLVFCLLVEVPWSQREWALPFLVFPVLSQSTSEQLGKPPRSAVEWATILIGRVRRWYPERDLVVVGDGYYAALPLVRQCQQFARPVTLVARLRWNARLFEEPVPPLKAKPGPKPKKGSRQPHLDVRLADPETEWQTVTLRWYGGRRQPVQLATGRALWHRPGADPVCLRWVIVRSLPTDQQPIDPTALLCSDPTKSAVQIVTWFLGRWNIEVTFEELRRHLGFGTQRQWSQKAIERTTPCLFGTFSVVVLMATTLHPKELPVASSRWYAKTEATFSDVLAAVRAHLWASWDYRGSAPEQPSCQIPRALFEGLHRVACYAV